MSTKRMKFSAAEKFKVALEAIKGELTIAEIASKYFVHPTQIGNWKKRALDYLAAAFTDKSKPQISQEDELNELYQEIGKLKVENDFLKKKCDLFIKR
jgi:transposase